MQIGQVDIADIEIDMTSRDDIPSILLGLQYIYTTEPLRKAVFKILEDVIPTQKKDNMGESIAVDANKGRPGMDQWCILVLGTLRLGLNADYDRIQELANQHRSLRAMLGHGLFTTDKDYRLQRLPLIAITTNGKPTALFEGTLTQESEDGKPLVFSAVYHYHKDSKR